MNNRIRTYEDLPSATSRDHPAYASMRRFAQIHKMPITYASDLGETDRDDLRRMSVNKSFVWIVREHGTFILRSYADTPQSVRQTVLEYGANLIASLVGGSERFECYHWNAATGSLQRIDAASVLFKLGWVDSVAISSRMLSDKAAIHAQLATMGETWHD